MSSKNAESLKSRIKTLEAKLDHLNKVYDFVLSGMNYWIMEQDEEVKKAGGILTWFEGIVEEANKQKEQEKDDE